MAKVPVYKVVVEGVSLTMAKVLYDKLEALAKNTDTHISDYAYKILKGCDITITGGVPSESEDKMLLKLFEFCLIDCVNTGKASNNLHTEKK